MYTNMNYTFKNKCFLDLNARPLADRISVDVYG